MAEYLTRSPLALATNSHYSRATRYWRKTGRLLPSLGITGFDPTRKSDPTQVGRLNVTLPGIQCLASAAIRLLSILKIPSAANFHSARPKESRFLKLMRARWKPSDDDSAF